MFIDTSAFVEILARQAEARQFELALENHSQLYTSALVRLEAVMVLTRFNLGSAFINQQAFDAIVEDAGIKFIDLNDAVGRLAVEAFAQFGKGQQRPGKLNLADCMHYAAAKYYKLPMLCKGDDFAKTDIDLVELPPG